MSLKDMPLYATFWREFYERPTIVYFMVHPEGEYHFRDVVSLMELSRVFPLGLMQVRFCPVIPGVTSLRWRWSNKNARTSVFSCGKSKVAYDRRLRRRVS